MSEIAFLSRTLSISCALSAGAYTSYTIIQISVFAVLANADAGIATAT